MDTRYETTQETEPTFQGEMLTKLSEGKPYIFLTADVSEDGMTLKVGMHTNIPTKEHHISKYLLGTVLDILEEHEQSEE
jgi:hypothetical protein